MNELEDKDVEIIKELFKGGILIKDLSKQFNKSRTTISDIVHNKSYILTKNERKEKIINIGKKKK